VEHLTEIQRHTYLSVL